MASDVRGSYRLGLLAALLLASVELPRLAGAQDSEPARQVRVGEHFEVRFSEGPEFAQEVLSAAEGYYERIGVALGFDRAVGRDHLSFWLWDKRLRIELFSSAEEYRGRTGAPEWSAGFVRHAERTVYSYSDCREFLESVLPHEMTHVLFREFVGYDNPAIQPWLDEGVATLGELRARDEAPVRAEHALAGRYLPFAQFTSLRPGPALDPTAARVFYAQAASVVEFLLEDYGTGRFVEFLRNLRDGYPLERALSFATGGRLDSVGALERAWLRFLSARR